MKDFRVFKTVASLQEELAFSSNTAPLCFVPTMGALHHGHLNLVREAFRYSDRVVVSIFVNPTQFNNASDLANYPRTLEADLELLSTIGNVVVFAPDVSEMYPFDFHEISLELGALEAVMEGAFRPGHFKGVVNVVKRLFDIVEPAYAFFGIKDYQQLAVIQHMVNELRIPVNIVPCETTREESGLASSSRNTRLNEQELDEARIIYQTICFARAYSAIHTPAETLKAARAFFEASSLVLEYMEIVDPITLKSIQEWEPNSRMCIAAWCGKVRLIDNDVLN
ncbi:MAG: pantoate--beta-alanine ligase [Bacteroidetes bacterium RIFCSPHIGHO2_02_FULL_44_7]|nr:MAG: pantoate--beta-alanine ligase [Bacteroidetes bacterium RIFCSPHIGHO2_02_FULL_44_7]